MAGWGGYVRHASLSVQFDSDYNMPFATVPVNSRSIITERRGTNGVHPDTPGYLQIGDAAYRELVRVWS